LFTISGEVLPLGRTFVKAVRSQYRTFLARFLRVSQQFFALATLRRDGDCTRRAIRYFIGEKSVGRMYTTSIFSTVLLACSDLITS